MKIVATHFTDDTRICRKLKKRMKRVMGNKFFVINNVQRRWYYLYLTNKSHHEFLINKILQK